MAAIFSPPTARALIEALPLVPVPGISEISLHLATPRSGVRALALADPDGFGTPYWAHCWGGGLALARTILDVPAMVSGRRVLDLGSGSGLVAIAAVKAGAAAVVAAEIDPHARLALAINGAANGAGFEIVGRDMLDEATLAVDVVLAGDVFYAPDLARRVTAWFDRCLAAGQVVFVGDPFRKDLPQHRLAPIVERTVRDFGQVAPVRAGVFRWTAPTD